MNTNQMRAVLQRAADALCTREHAGLAVEVNGVSAALASLAPVSGEAAAWIGPTALEHLRTRPYETQFVTAKVPVYAPGPSGPWVPLYTHPAAPSVSGEAVAWACVSGECTIRRVSDYREAMEIMAVGRDWRVVPLYLHPATPSVSLTELLAKYEARLANWTEASESNPDSGYHNGHRKQCEDIVHDLRRLTAGTAPKENDDGR